MAPWRIAEQTIVMKMPDGEVGPALQFTIDPANSAQCRLRVVSPEPDTNAYEVVFTTGGLVVEQVYQPRILKPFARGPIMVPPEPIKVAVRPEVPEGESVLLNPLTNRPETDAEREKREALQKLKDEREPTEAQPTGEPDSTDPNSPGAQARRAAEAGVEASEPEKGIVSQGIPTNPGIGQPNAPNAVDQQLQKQGKAPLTPKR